jgi:hypothetical protein
MGSMYNQQPPAPQRSQPLQANVPKSGAPANLPNFANMLRQGKSGQNIPVREGKSGQPQQPHKSGHPQGGQPQQPWRPSYSPQKSGQPQWRSGVPSQTPNYGQNGANNYGAPQ